jgi:membrane associated rhomboid family serine protease
MVSGDVLAGIGSRRTIQSPLPLAVVIIGFFKANWTVTSSPADAVPHTGTGISRCNTAWSVNIAGTVTSAPAGVCGIWTRKKKTRKSNRLFISSSFGKRNRGGLIKL